MQDEHILCERREGVLVIEIRRREKKNALTSAMYSALASALARAAEQSAVRAVLIRGQEDLFTAGNDLEDFLQRKATDESQAMRFLHVISVFEKPVVAAVAGHAVGIGTTMLLHCDLVYAADNAKFQLPFVNLALCPEAASSLLLPRAAGHRRAAELLMLGDPFDAAKAVAAGIVNEVLPADRLMDHAFAKARVLADKPATALAVTKALMRRPVRAEVDEAMREEAIHFADLVSSAPAKEIFAAFLEKRPVNPAKVHGEGR
ncbi:MAG: enoyl-CoA hydratase/isomerase family protein [Rhodocyclaceae bacterium]|nr:enoyl-CoA hydratase/isomerase family protein [Rhodocyclaceae bacterium]